MLYLFWGQICDFVIHILFHVCASGLSKLEIDYTRRWIAAGGRAS